MNFFFILDQKGLIYLEIIYFLVNSDISIIQIVF